MRLDSSDPGFADAFETLVSARREPATDVASGVAAILADVRARGDAALHELTLRFDRIDLDQAGWSVPREARQAALQGLEPDLRAALEMAAARIRAYHAGQQPRSEARRVGTACVSTCGYRWSPYHTKQQT